MEKIGIHPQPTQSGGIIIHFYPPFLPILPAFLPILPAFFPILSLHDYMQWKNSGRAAYLGKMRRAPGQQVESMGRKKVLTLPNQHSPTLQVLRGDRLAGTFPDTAAEPLHRLRGERRGTSGLLIVGKVSDLQNEGLNLLRLSTPCCRTGSHIDPGRHPLPAQVIRLVLPREHLLLNDALSAQGSETLSRYNGRCE